MNKPTKQAVRHLVLYQDDFQNDKIWRDVCDSLQIHPDHGDKVVIYYDMKPAIMMEAE